MDDAFGIYGQPDELDVCVFVFLFVFAEAKISNWRGSEKQSWLFFLTLYHVSFFFVDLLNTFLFITSSSTLTDALPYVAGLSFGMRNFLLGTFPASMVVSSPPDILIGGLVERLAFLVKSLEWHEV